MHPDEETLARLALGEPVGAEVPQANGANQHVRLGGKGDAPGHRFARGIVTHQRMEFDLGLLAGFGLGVIGQCDGRVGAQFVKFLQIGKA